LRQPLEVGGDGADTAQKPVAQHRQTRHGEALVAGLQRPAPRAFIAWRRRQDPRQGAAD